MDDGVARAHRLAGLHPKIVDDAVALVEEADDRDAILHRRQPGFIPLQNLARVGGLKLLLIALLLAAARRQRDRECGGNGGRKPHSYSGVQGW
ncbi:MAG: hypothetical protein ACTHN4_10280 [Sphingomicrobium sp.]